GPPESATAFTADLQARYGDFAGRFLQLYPASSDAEAEQSQLRLKSDDVSWRMMSWARFQSKRGVRHVYVYRFSSVPPFAPWGKPQCAGLWARPPLFFGIPRR